MKQIVRYRFMTIPNKLNGELKISVDDRGAEYAIAYESGKSTTIGIFPIISIVIARQPEIDDSGNRTRPAWNINDSLGLTKFTLPVFIRELKGMEKDLQISDLYSYQGTRLELNTEVAQKVRRAFMLGNMAVELTAVVIEQSDERRIEGIKMKFNNEQSTVLLTLNELTALIYNVEHINVDDLTLQLYLAYIERKKSVHTRESTAKSVIDIDIPSSLKMEDFKDFEEASQ